MRRALLGLAAVGLLVSAPAAAREGATTLSPARCETIAAKLQATVREMALLSAEGRYERSTLRATTRATEISNLQAENQTRLAQLAAGGCPAYDGPVGPSAYAKAAGACQAAELAKTNRLYLERELARTGRLPDLGPATNAQQALDDARAATPPELACDQTKWVAEE